MASVLQFADIEKSQVALVGGKCANLGYLVRRSIPVPVGCCVTTNAYRAFVSENPPLAEMVRNLEEVTSQFASSSSSSPPSSSSSSSSSCPVRVKDLSMKIRSAFREASLPRHIVSDIIRGAREVVGRYQHQQHQNQVSAAPSIQGSNGYMPLQSSEFQLYFAVRSSATAEDSLGASFAGLHDSFLNVPFSHDDDPARKMRIDLVDRVRDCWASLFSERAILCRMKNAINHTGAAMAVALQVQVVAPAASGVMFTADPVDGCRHRMAVDAAFGVGEAVVSGTVNPDSYRYDKRLRTITSKRLSSHTRTATTIDKPLRDEKADNEQQQQQPLQPETRQQHQQVLSDRDITRLAEMGRYIEETFYTGEPQDIEWCYVVDSSPTTSSSINATASTTSGVFYVLQSRPISTLFPVPPSARPEDRQLRFFVSYNHVQVTLDAISPLGRDCYRAAYPFAHEPTTRRSRIMQESGCRLWLDMTDGLRLPFGRWLLMRFISLGDPRIASAVRSLLQRDEVAHPAYLLVSSWGFFWGVAKFWGPVIPKILYRIVFGSPEAAAFDVERTFQESLILSRQRIEDAAKRSVEDEFPDIFVMKRPPTGAGVDEEVTRQDGWPNDDSARRRRTVSSFSQKLRAYEDELIRSFRVAAMQMCSNTESGVLSYKLLRWIFSFVSGGNTATSTTSADLDAISKGVSGNVTTDMDLALGDLAELARTEPQICDFFTHIGGRNGGEGRSDDNDSDDSSGNINHRQITRELFERHILQLQRSSTNSNSTRNKSNDSSSKSSDFHTTSKFVQAFNNFLDKYGCRAPTEIDIATPRFQEKPAHLFNVIRSRLLSCEPPQQNCGADLPCSCSSSDAAAKTISTSSAVGVASHRRKFQSLAAESAAAAARLVSSSPWWCANFVVLKLIRNVRGYLPIREAPKLFFLRYLAMFRSDLVGANFGRKLVRLGVIPNVESVFLFRIPELIEIARVLDRYNNDGSNTCDDGDGNCADEKHHDETHKDNRVDPFSVSSSALFWAPKLLEERKLEMSRFKNMKPPRVLTSEGEIVSGSVDRYAADPRSDSHEAAHHRTNESFPKNALFGNIASSGVVEGVARVVHDPAREMLRPGEILVAPFTDPGWTPLFINAAGVVTEIGGLMSHGSVIAREYGIPCLVSVDHVTTEIKTGQRIRVDAENGYVCVI